MKRLLISFLGPLILLSSCSIQYNYLNKFDSNDARLLNDSLMFENEDLILSYDFSDATCAFTIYNKTDETIFIDWEQSNLIVNDCTLYYANLDPGSYKVGKVSIDSMPGNPIIIDAKSQNVLSPNIPPGLSISVEQFGMGMQLFSSKDRLVRKEIRNNGIKQDTFNVGNTPFLIQNQILYSSNEDMASALTVTNKFWLSEAAIMAYARYADFYYQDTYPNLYVVKEYRTDQAAVAATVIGVAVLGVVATVSAIGSIEIPLW